MQKLIYFLLFIILTFVVKAEDKITKEKRLTKTFMVEETPNVKVATSYGVIRYEIGSSNKVEFVVDIIVKGNKADEVEDKINSISVDFSKSGNNVSAETTFSKCRSRNINMKINYTIKLPTNSTVAVASNYVDIHLPSQIKEVQVASNYTDVYMQGECSSIYFKGNYNDLKTSSLIKKANFKGNYNDFETGSIESLVFGGNYNDIVATSINKTAEFSGNYSDIEINNISPLATSIDIRGNYTDAEINCNNYTEVNITGVYSDVLFSNKYNVLINKEERSHTTFKAQTSNTIKTYVKASGNYLDIKLK